MAKYNNLTDFLTDVADAIREKKGTSEPINPQDFSDEIASIEVGGGDGWTGHADAEGLRAIGWTEEDIAYYQEHGVDWNEEDDHLHLVSDDNKALYGVLTASNISTYKDRIVYLPKIDISSRTSISSLFKDCINLVAIPILDTNNITQMGSAFLNCYSLKILPRLNLEKAVNLSSSFKSCYSLSYTPEFNLPKATAMTSTFAECSALKDISVVASTNLTVLDYSVQNCYALRSIKLRSVNKATSASYAFTGCYNMQDVDIDDITTSLSFSQARILKKKSLVNIINNEASTSAITITLATSVYDRYANDPDVLAALANHPNITLAK